MRIVIFFAWGISLFLNPSECRADTDGDSIRPPGVRYPPHPRIQPRQTDEETTIHNQLQEQADAYRKAAEKLRKEYLAPLEQTRKSDYLSVKAASLTREIKESSDLMRSSTDADREATYSPEIEAKAEKLIQVLEKVKNRLKSEPPLNPAKMKVALRSMNAIVDSFISAIKSRIRNLENSQ